MSKNGPNKTVAKARRRMGGFPNRTRPIDPFISWLADMAREGHSFRTIEEAKEAFERRPT